MNSSDASFQMEWTPIQKSISNPISVTENKPKRQLEHLKPRMSIKGASATQPFDPRASMFSSSVKTESTNFTSESIASLNNGSFCMFNSSICRRSSIFFGDERRQTVNTKKNSTDLLVDDSKDDYEEFKAIEASIVVAVVGEVISVWVILVEGATRSEQIIDWEHSFCINCHFLELIC